MISYWYKYLYAICNNFYLIICFRVHFNNFNFESTNTLWQRKLYMCIMITLSNLSTSFKGDIHTCSWMREECVLFAYYIWLMEDRFITHDTFYCTSISWPYAILWVLFFYLFIPIFTQNNSRKLKGYLWTANLSVKGAEVRL